jgi:hypothetical protein
MEIVAPIFGLAMVAWALVVGRSLTGLVACGLFIALSYVLGPPFWSAKIGPLPLNVERLALLGLVAWHGWAWRLGRLKFRPLTRFDWVVLGLVGYLTLRCALTPEPTLERAAVGAWWRLISAFWIPLLLYSAVRSAELTETSWRGMLWVLTALGAYLGLTAFAEVTHQWWAVFPRYISNPEIGTHFGRARGPR